MRTSAGFLVGGLLSTAPPVVADVPAAPAPAPTAIAEPAPPATARFVTTPAPTVESYWRWDDRALATGAVLVGLGYAAAAITAAGDDRDGDPRLYVPVVGPWLDLAARDACPRRGAPCDDVGAVTLRVGVGLLQALGAFVVADALLFPTRVERTLAIAGHAVGVAPVAMGSGGRGFALRGDF